MIETAESAQYTVAPMSKRFANYVVDFISYLAFSFCIGILAGLVGFGEFIEAVPDFVLGAILLVAFYTFFEYVWSQTPGKFLTKTKVVSVTGEEPTLNQLLGRSASRVIPFEALSFLSSHPIGIHDSLARTLVVPKEYTPEQVRMIPPRAVKSQPILLAVLVIIGTVFVVGILALAFSNFS